MLRAISHETALGWVQTSDLAPWEHQLLHETALGWLRTSDLASWEHQSSHETARGWFRTCELASWEHQMLHETAQAASGSRYETSGTSEFVSLQPQTPHKTASCRLAPQASEFASREHQTSQETARGCLGTFNLPHNITRHRRHLSAGLELPNSSQEHQMSRETAPSWLETSEFASPTRHQ